MRGVADEDDTADVPSVELQPLDGSAMDLLVGLETIQIVSDQPAESGEVITQTLASAIDRIMQARPRHVAEAIRTAVAHRAQAEETPIPEVELDTAGLLTPDRGQAPPGRLTAINRRRVAERQLARGRRDAIGADDQGVLIGGAIAELDPDPASS